MMDLKIKIIDELVDYFRYSYRALRSIEKIYIYSAYNSVQIVTDLPFTIYCFLPKDTFDSKMTGNLDLVYFECAIVVKSYANMTKVHL